MKKLLFLFSLCVLTASSAFSQNEDNTYYTDDQATVTEKAQQAPPPLPDYTQPPCPVEGYIWTPGYWAWGAAGYYWVPGIWVMPPHPGLLWTPGYWGFYNGYYGWHHGYWGATVGYYGGINYGFGYYGTGFYGGRWEGGVFLYNTAVWHVNPGVIHHTYVNHVNYHVVSHASFNGPGGIRYRPTADEVRVMHDTHVERTNEQVAHHQTFVNDRAQMHNEHVAPAVHSMSAPNGQRFNAGGHAVHAAPAMHSAPAHGGGGRR